MNEETRAKLAARMEGDARLVQAVADEVLPWIEEVKRQRGKLQVALDELDRLRDAPPEPKAPETMNKRWCMYDDGICPDGSTCEFKDVRAPDHVDCMCCDCQGCLQNGADQRAKHEAKVEASRAKDKPGEREAILAVCDEWGYARVLEIAELLRDAVGF